MRSAHAISPPLVRLLALAAAFSAPALVGEAVAWAAPIKVACVGEQTTHSDQLNRTVEYPAMLQTELGAAYDAQNFGDCCSTVLTGYPKQPETHPYLLGGSAPSYKESLTFAPDIVVIGSWGKHDTEIANSVYAGVLDATRFQADYETLVTTYVNLPNKPRVFLSTPVPIPKGAPTGPTTDVILPTVRAMATKYGLPIVDLYPAFLNQPQLYKDDTHVTNVAGLQKIADTVFAEITGQTAGADGGGGGAPDAATPVADAADVVEASVGIDSGGGSSPVANGGGGGGGAPGGAPSPAAGSNGCATAPGPAPGDGVGALFLAACAALARRRRDTP